MFIFCYPILKIFLDIHDRFEYNYIMKEYSKKPWTYEERQYVRDNYGKLSMEELLAALPDRNENSIRKQVSYLRKRGWTFNKGRY